MTTDKGHFVVDYRSRDPRLASPAFPMCRWSWRFRAFKAICDYGFAVLALPLVGLTGGVLLILNPFFNRGPLFFRQERMGRGGKRFVMWKFRTMRPGGHDVRPHDAPLEEDRITPLGALLRRTRLDELPNAFNILAGEMSLVGPRPEAYDHALEFIDSIPYYRDRFRVLPGITGLAQVRAGYADEESAVRRKARLDHHYVWKARLRLDARVLVATVAIVLFGTGAK